MAWGDGLRPEDEDKKWGSASSTENNTANEKKEDEREYAYYKIPLANKNEIKQLKYLGFIVIICIANLPKNSSIQVGIPCSYFAQFFVYTTQLHMVKYTYIFYLLILIIFL